MIAGTAVLAQYAATGDPESFRQLVEAHHGLVRSACARLLRDPSQVDDAVQETFWSLARHAGEVRGNIAGWLHATATNHALSALRSDKARRQREQAVQAPDTDTEAEGADAVAWKELRGDLDQALAGLDPEVRECVVRHYLLGQHLAAIAADQRCSVTAVHKRVQRGLEQLRRRLGRHGMGLGLAALASLLAGPAQAACLAADPSALPELARIGLAAPRPRSVPGDWPAVGAGRRTAGWLAACIGCALLAGWLGWRFAPARAVAPGPPPAPAPVAAAEEPQGPPILAALTASPPAPGPVATASPVAALPAPAPTATSEALLFRDDFAGRIGAVTSLPNWGMAIGMRRAPDGTFDPANPCLAVRAATPTDGAGAPAAFLHVDAWFCDLWLNPRLSPAPDGDFTVRYRMRLSASRNEAPLASFPWFCYRDAGAHPGSGRGTPTDLDDRVKATLPLGRWLSVEACFRRGGEARAWSQAIAVDGVERFRFGFLADRSDIMLHVRQGTVELAEFAVVRPAAVAAF